MKYSGRQATREGAVGKGILHVNSSYAHHCFFYKETVGYEAGVPV